MIAKSTLRQCSFLHVLASFTMPLVEFIAAAIQFEKVKEHEVLLARVLDSRYCPRSLLNQPVGCCRIENIVYSDYVLFCDNFVNDDLFRNF